MLRLRMERAGGVNSIAERRGLARAVREIQSARGSREAVEHLLHEVGFGLRDRDEGYFAEALDFHLGLLEAYAGRPQMMADHIQKSLTMPGPDDECLYSDHVALSTASRRRQLAAVQRGLPAVLFACMPRSASATLTHTLAKLLDVPVLHVSAGRIQEQFIVPCWLDMFLEGGAITQDHFTPNDFNRGVLASRGGRDLWITVRDPRAAARSQVHWLAPAGYETALSLELRIERECVEHSIPWINSWLDAARSGALPFRIHLLRFPDIVGDLAGTVRSIAGCLSSEFAEMAPFAEARHVEEVRIHFKEGDDQAWRAEVGEATRRKLWEACSPEIREFLDLVP